MAIDYSITKSYDMYFRDFYSIDRNASKSEQRASYKTNKLAKADSSAMTKISKTLRKMDFSQDNGNDILHSKILCKCLQQSYGKFGLIKRV